MVITVLLLNPISLAQVRLQAQPAEASSLLLTPHRTPIKELRLLPTAKVAAINAGVFHQLFNAYGAKAGCWASP
jgi:hypothetical protein